MSRKKKKTAPEDVERIKKERDEYLEGWKRAKADLANFKKESIEMIGRAGEVAKRELVYAIIPTLEAFEESAKNDIEGLNGIHLLLLGALQDEGIEVLSPRPGESFNPEQHEAVEGTGDIVSEVLRKGYAFNKRTLKPAIVRVKNA